MSSVVKVRVVVYEDDEEVAEVNTGYYAGQVYEVKIETDDGVDAQLEREAGKE